MLPAPTMNDQLTLRTVARIGAACAASSPADERAANAVEALRAVVPITAAMLCAVDVASGASRELLREGYSPALGDYMLGSEFHAGLVERFALPRPDWLFRERDMPIDPLSVPAVAEHLRPEGYVEGMLAGLRAADGHYLGFLVLSVADRRHPSDDACAVVRCVTPMLAALVDPFESARRLVTLLRDDEAAAALLADGSLSPLRGVPPDALRDPTGALRRTAERVRGRPGRHVAFLVEGPAGSGWLACRAYGVRDGSVVVATRSSPDVHGLTHRELDVLRRLVDGGQSNAEIAEDLVVTIRTVRAHVERILEKLGVPSRAGAVARALDEGLVWVS